MQCGPREGTRSLSGAHRIKYSSRTNLRYDCMTLGLSLSLSQGLLISIYLYLSLYLCLSASMSVCLSLSLTRSLARSLSQPRPRFFQQTVQRSRQSQRGFDNKIHNYDVTNPVPKQKHHCLIRFQCLCGNCVRQFALLRAHFQ